MQHSTGPTRKILTTFTPIPPRSSESPSTEKKYPSNPYSFLIRTQIPDISRLTSPVAGKLFYDAGSDISRNDLANGYVLYAADLTPDMCGSSDHFNVVQRGNLAVDIKFTTAPTAAVSLVCYGEFENTIHIDSERNVISTILVKNMSTAQIPYALEHDPKTSKKFCGVFSSDKLPQTIDKYPCGLVANTDASTKPGKYCISIYLSSPRKGSWFDSYGKPPEFYGAAFTDFLEKHCDDWDVN